MRYLSNFLEDRMGLYDYSSVGSTPSNVLSTSSNVRSTSSNQSQLVESFTDLNNPTITSASTGTADLFKSAGSNTSTIYQSIGGNTTDWTSAGAYSLYSDDTGTHEPSYSDQSREMRAHIDKFGETPTYVGSDGKVHVDREALIQRVVDYYVGPEGGSMNLDGFSVDGFMAADNDGRMSMLKSMREQNDAAKAAKFEEDMRLAQERDAAKETAANPQQQNNTWTQLITAIQQGMQIYAQAKAAG